MKPRAKFPINVDKLSLLSLEAVKESWAHFPKPMQDLHQCRCMPTSGTYHKTYCPYVANPDHETALYHAATYILNNAGSTAPGQLLAEDIDPALQSDTDTAELTLSFITDPIEIKGGYYFDNGRHRVTALIDLNVVGRIPVRLRP